MLSAHPRQRGVTLVELMIAGAISLVALSAALTVYSATARHSTLQLRSAHLHQQVLGILYLVSRDLRRAGYWHFDPARRSPVDNPFQNDTNRVRSGALAGEAADSCILLSYDLDRDGLVGVGQCNRQRCPPFSDGDNVEQFGYRLHDGAVQSRYAGSGLACDAGYWQALNDPDIRITHLRFGLRAHCINLRDRTAPCNDAAPQLVQRLVRIDIGARLEPDPDSRISLVQWVALRNDRLQAAEP
jgi:prepilin-type N-terminal cleavage/methylation domain-containing protein